MTPAERLAGLRALLAAGLSDEALDEAISGLYRGPKPAGKPRSSGAERQRRWRERLARDASETSRETSQRDANETPVETLRDAPETLGAVPAPPRARSLEDLSSPLVSGSDSEKIQSQNPPTTFGGGPPQGARDDGGETVRDASCETPAAETPKRGTKSDREARGTRCPKSDVAPADLAAWLAGHGIPAATDPEVVKFLDHHRAKGTRSLDWPASWRTWARNAERFAAGRSPRGGGIPASVPRVQGGFADFQEFQRMKANLEALQPADPPPTQEQLDTW